MPQSYTWPSPAKTTTLWHTRKYAGMDRIFSPWSDSACISKWCTLKAHRCFLWCPTRLCTRPNTVSNNDIDNDINSSVRLFADDSLLYRTSWCHEDQVSLQHDLDTLQLWADTWLMDFNVAKCKLLTISQKKKTSLFSYTLKGIALENVKEHPYLGVTISSTLSNSNHCSNIAQSASRTLNTVRRTLYPCSKSVKERAYQALVRPKLEYAAIAWKSYTNKDNRRIEQVQRNAASFVCNDYRRETSVTNLVTSLDWQSLRRRAQAYHNSRDVLWNSEQ